MKRLIDWFNKKFPSNQWEMDPDYKVEYMTDYGDDDFAREVETSLNRFGRRLNLFLRATEVGAVSFHQYIKGKFGLSSNTAYLLKLNELLEDEVDAYLLDTEPNKELKEEYANIKFLGSSYDPSYDHEAYIKKAKENSITG